MKVTLLGTGTSTGVPQIGCKCEVCKSENPKDKRLRTSALIEDGNTRILIDCGPDFRQQILRLKNDAFLDGVIISHEHYDHIGGLDDLRPLGNIKIFAENRVANIIKRNMPYCFGESRYPGSPEITLREIDTAPFFINKTKIIPIRVMHMQLPILGFRIKNVAYLTDVKTIEESEFEKLKNLDVLILNALRQRDHISHLSLSEALEMTKKIGAKQTYFTHLSHDMGLHDAVNVTLPDNISIGYDSQIIHI